MRIFVFYEKFLSISAYHYKSSNDTPYFLIKYPLPIYCFTIAP